MRGILVYLMKDKLSDECSHEAVKACVNKALAKIL